MTTHVLPHVQHPEMLVANVVSGSVTVAGILGALPTFVSVIAGVLTSVFMVLQILVAYENWQHKRRENKREE